MQIEKPIGKYSEKQAKKYLKIGLIFLIPFILLFIFSINGLPIYSNWGKFEIDKGMLMGMSITVSLFFILLPYQIWKSGLNGEKKVVENISSKLGSEHALFNDVIIKDGLKLGNIDHIIVGPRGIFAIETKNTKNEVVVNGDYWTGLPKSPSRQARQARQHAGRIHTLLDKSNILREQFPENFPYVKAVVVLATGKAKLVVEKKPESCTVLQIKDKNDTSLYDCIMKEDVIFSTKDIEKIIDYLHKKIIYD